jgi:predicted Zn-ribbon and HTH transcriptional regulator
MIAARYENSSKPRAAHPFGGLFPSLNSIQFLHHIKKERSMAGKFDPPAVCAKCGGAMEAGLSMNKDMEHWQKVERAAGKFLGRSYEGYKRVGTSLPVLHYRCTDCGYLEAYAPLR